MQEIQKAYKDKSVAVVMINVDEERAMVPIFLKKRPATATVLLNEGGVNKTYGVRGIPANFIIDKKGVVRQFIIGFDKGGEKKLRERIDVLLAEGEKAASATQAKE